jgi:hypothetical protein
MSRNVTYERSALTDILNEAKENESNRMEELGMD